MKFLVVCLFVCLASVFTAPLDNEDSYSDPLLDLLDAHGKRTVDNGNNDDANDPQPAEEKLTPATGKFEGDILLTPEEEKEIEEADKNVGKRGGGLGTNYDFRWPENKVYYRLNSRLSTSARSGIQAAMADWEKYTCTRFIHGSSPKGHYIHIFPGNGCYSYLGYTKKAGQELSIGRGCEQKGVVMHELAHAQGILHEQSRMDRDRYVRIRFENVRSGMEHNFKKHVGAQTAGVPYDYQSMMHYGDKYFSKNGQPTIVTRTGARIGNRSGFSSTDIKFANAFLQCSNGGGAPGPAAPKDTWPQSLCNIVKRRNYCRFSTYRRRCAATCA